MNSLQLECVKLAQAMLPQGHPDEVMALAKRILEFSKGSSSGS